MSSLPIEAQARASSAEAQPTRGARGTESREVLVLNRDPELRVLVNKALYIASLSSLGVSSETEALACLAKGDVGLFLIGVDSPESIELIARVHKDLPAMTILAVARTATPDLVRDILRAGASDFLFGTVDARSFAARLLTLMEARSELVDRGQRPPADAAPATPGTPEDLGIIHSSRSMARVLEIAEKIGPTDSTVLIQGESGTGKELIAKHIHQLSKRAARTFVAINCGALPENLLESQLFGHERGSFTGAVQRQVGLFEIADQGTIFLDEIGEMGLDMQVKLLRVLQSRELRRLGGSQVVKVDVRVIAATNKDLKAEVEQKLFRSDLFYRLNVISLEVPPLRERPEEIPAMVDCFAKRFAKERGVPLKSFSPDAIERLQRYRWTGNVRELENAVERMILLSKKDVVEAGDLDEHLGVSAEVSTESPFSPAMSLDEVKRIHIANVLRENAGNKMRTARILKINVKTLYNLMRRLEIQE
jgi:DNA-binding NtrC family response regulator